MLLLRNGRIIDGTGAPAFSGSVLIDGERIREVGSFTPPAECETIDCSGLAITPGFIDLHSHSDLQVLEGHTAKIDQGVTTEVVGNCGFSPYPYVGDKEALRNYANGILCGEGDWGFADAREYLEEASRRANATNVVSLLGHGSLRTAFMGGSQNPASEPEMQRMEGALDDALAAGAAGFSTGLMYAPGSGAPREELVRLLKLVAKRGKVHATHMRSYSWQLDESIEEQLSLARETGARLQVSHLQAVGQKNWAKQDRVLERLEQARTEGIDVEFDSYPYLAGSTVATQLLPQAALDGSTSAMLARIANPDTRAKLTEEINAQTAQRWSDIYITAVASAGNQQFVGRTFQQAAEHWETTPVEALFRLLTEEEGKVNILSFNQSEENLRKLMIHPLGSVISDGFYVKGRPHPRLYGTFAELLGGLVREKGWLSIEAAVHKVTAKPAARMHMKGVGTLVPGYYADLTVFDPAKIASRATYDDPCHAPIGIEHVIRRGQMFHRP